MDLKTCPNCGTKVLTLITDCGSRKQYCYHCIPNPEACPGAVFVSRKMHELHAAGKLETYPLEQRLKDMKDPPRCKCDAVLDVPEGELCSKCRAKAARLMASQDTYIRLYENPRPVHLDWITAQHVTTFYAAGIVNPAGPTLNAVVAAGMLETGATLPVIQLMLNPVSQEMEAVGEICVGETWRPSVVFSPLFGLRYGSCPSLLLPSVLLEDRYGASIYAAFLSKFADARRVLEDVKQYFGNPWDRVSNEMNRSLEALKKSAPEPKKPLSEEESVELAELLLSEQHMKPELQAFFFAWKGSIEHFAHGLATMSLENFQGVLAHLAASCRLPDSDKN